MRVADLHRLSYDPGRRSKRPGRGRGRRIRLILIARCCAGELDRQLAAGASPDASAARVVIATLDRRLRAPDPVSPRRITRVESLLTDDISPLYRPAQPGALGSQLRAAAAALEPPTRHAPVRVRREISR